MSAITKAQLIEKIANMSEENESLTKTIANLEGLLHEAKQDNMAMQEEILALKAEMNRLMSKPSPSLPGGEDNIHLGGREVHEVMEKNGWQVRAGGCGYVKIYPNSTTQSRDLKEVKEFFNKRGLLCRSTTSGVKTVLLVVRAK